MIKATNNLTGKLNASIIKEYPELEDVTITPTLEEQIVKSENYYGINEVKVKGVSSYIDEDIKPEYIKEGVDILGVVGNVVELKGEEKTIVPKTEQQVILPSGGKNAMTKITVQAVDNTIDKDIKPENIVEGIEILGVVGNYKGIDTADATVKPEDVLEGKTVYINNEKITGTLPNNGELEFAPSDEKQDIPTGFTSGGTVLPTDITTLEEYEKCLTLANSIETLEDYTDTTATADDIIEGKTAYSNGEKLVGTLKENDNNAIMNSNISGGMDGSYKYPSLYKIIRRLPENSYINGTSALNMFYQCSALEYVPSLDMTRVTTAKGMFYSCINLPKIELTNTDNITNFSSFAQYCYKLEEIILGNTANATDFGTAFSGCSALKVFPYIDTSNANTVSNMFYDCKLLETFPVLDMRKAVSFSTMFNNCESLSDESLNNIMMMCINATAYSSTKTLKYMGISSAQATRCQSLSNYQAFLDAGWTTGY